MVVSPSGAFIPVPAVFFPVIGTQQLSSHRAGVTGVSHDNYGVFGHSKNSNAIHGETDSSTMAGVWGESMLNGEGVHGESNGTGAAVAGVARGSGLAGVFNGAVNITGLTTLSAINFNQPSTGTVTSDAYAFTVWNKKKGAILAKGNPAGRFEGDIEVTGDIKLINADCAEEFDLSSAENFEPGSVMVLNQSGQLEKSNRAYDKRVAGIVSGAGSYRPALILDKKLGKSDSKRIPLALMGKVYCKVDANYSPIEIGDLLTTSAAPGHAMKADDPHKSFGTVIGKALGSIKEGMGIILVLVALQ